MRLFFALPDHMVDFHNVVDTQVQVTLPQSLLRDCCMGTSAACAMNLELSVTIACQRQWYQHTFRISWLSSDII